MIFLVGSVLKLSSKSCSDYLHVRHDPGLDVIWTGCASIPVAVYLHSGHLNSVPKLFLKRFHLLQSTCM